MTKLCLECTKRYYFNVYFQKFPGGACPRTPPSWAWLCHAGTPPRSTSGHKPAMHQCAYQNACPNEQNGLSVWYFWQTWTEWENYCCGSHTFWKGLIERVSLKWSHWKAAGRRCLSAVVEQSLVVTLSHCCSYFSVLGTTKYRRIWGDGTTGLTAMRTMPGSQDPAIPVMTFIVVETPGEWCIKPYAKQKSNRNKAVWSTQLCRYNGVTKSGHCAGKMCLYRKASEPYIDLCFCFNTRHCYFTRRVLTGHHHWHVWYAGTQTAVFSVLIVDDAHAQTFIFYKTFGCVPYGFVEIQTIEKQRPKNRRAV